MELTKSAKKSIALLYKDYLARIKNGEPKQCAAEFPDDTAVSSQIKPDRQELVDAGLIKKDILDTVYLTTKGIAFMESLTVDTIKEWLSFVAQFIP